MSDKKLTTKQELQASAMFKTPEEMQASIDKYIKGCVPEYLKDDKGQYITDKGSVIVFKWNNPTMTGLALHLGFASRQSMYDYEKKPSFTYTIKRARLYIENSYEQDIRNPSISATGSIFALKNLGWSDKQEIQHTTIDKEGEATGINFIE